MRRFIVPVLGMLALTATPAFARTPTVVQISADPFTNSTSQHMTEVEPDTYAAGNVIVSAFQVGRFYDGGSSDIGWATSANGGMSWTYGFLPGITQIVNPSNPYARATDPSVAYDAKHGVWLILSLPLDGNATGLIPVVSSSTDGVNWNNPVKVAPDNGDFMDKSWIACDSWQSSPNYGHCYAEWDDVYQGDQIYMSTSTNGGQTWSTPLSINNAFGLGGQPLAQPNGNVVVPYEGFYGPAAFSSTNGGKSWGSNVTIANGSDSGVAGSLRTEQLPSAEVDGSGLVYVVWQDCSFRPNCSSNDIVMSTSANGTAWSSPSRIPIDPTTSGADHFIPGIAVDKRRSGARAHLGLTYYFYPNASCNTSTCQLEVGYIGSKSGGATWQKSKTLAGPMKTPWLADTNQGYMVGDYISTSFVGKLAFGVFAVATAPQNGVFNEAMFTTNGLTAEVPGPELSTRGERRLPVRPHKGRWYRTTI